MELHKYLLIPSIIAIACIYSCGKVQEPSVKELKSVNILGQTDSTLQLTATLVMHNPNSFEIPLTEADYHISIHGKEIGDGKEINLPPLVKDGDTDLSLKPTLHLAQFSEIVPQLMTEKETEVEIEGIYSFSLLGQHIPISQTTKTKVNIQNLIQQYMEAAMKEGSNGLKVKNVRIGQANLMETKVLADLIFTNSLPIDYTIDKIHLDLFPPDKQDFRLGEWNLNTPQTLIHGQTLTIPIEIKLSNMAVLATMPDIVRNRQNQSLFVKGTAEAKMGKNTFKVPIAQIVKL